MLKVTRCEFVHNLPCEQVSGRLTELEAENAKLRNDLEDANNQAEEVCIENAKLRELVAQRTAKRVVASNEDTDFATGHTACGSCGGAIDPWDAWCRHCGTKLEEDA